ncbi:AraC family transcriptional regulator [Catenuloplanes nepalensis]|nr:helix-turn-helix domain-containing protein [Catenuloplanes nepalensis]
MCDWADSVEILTGTGPVPVLTLLPDVSASLIFGALGDGDGILVATGPRSRAQFHFAKPLRYGVRVRIRPGHAREVLGVPVADLTDRMVPAAALWGATGRPHAEHLAALVAGEPPALPGADALSLFPGRSVALPSPLPMAGRAVWLSAALAELGAGAPMRAAAARIGVGERRLRTVFAQEIGVSPKHAARILRLRRVLAAQGTVEHGWARVAGEHGFFDQAHLIGDFRALMGVSPGAYAAGRLPESGPCLKARSSAGTT